MLRISCALIIALTMCGCAGAERSNVNFDGASYRLVTGKRLRAAFVGKKIRYPDPYRIGDIVLTSSIRCDGFYPDGRYVSCGDRVPRPQGTFAIYSDRVCVIVHATRCYQLYESTAGAYLLGHPGEQPAVEPIDFVSADDDTVPPRM